MKKKTGLILVITGAVLCVTGVVLLILAYGKWNQANKLLTADGSAETRVTAEAETQPAEENGENSPAENNAGDNKGETENDGRDESLTDPENDKDAEAKTADYDLAAPSVCGALSVDGTQLVDENGNPVQLKGISTHGIGWFPTYVDQNAFRQFRNEWNVNVMRLAMYTHENSGYCTDGNKEDLKNIVKRGIQYATDNDMYVIIDWHVLNENSPLVYEDEAKKFFEEMAKTYADQNNILYEICNEPCGGTSWSDVKKYAEDIIPIIRKYDDDAIIIVGTPNWSQRVDEAAADPITGYDNIMYTLHFYAATHKDDLRNTMVNAIKAGLPVFISEFSICDASGNGGVDYDQAQKWMDVINEYGISYVAWSLSNKNETSALISSSCNKTSDFTESDLSETGKWLYKTLTGNSAVGNSKDAAKNSQSGGKNNSKNGQSSNSGQNNNNNGNNQNNGGQSFSFTSSGLNGTATLKSSWEDGGKTCYQFDVKLENPGSSDTSQWAIDIHFSGDIAFSSGWSGKYSANGNTLHVTNESYNGVIPAGGNISDIGFMITGPSGLTVTP